MILAKIKDVQNREKFYKKELLKIFIYKFIKKKKSKTKKC